MAGGIVNLVVLLLKGYAPTMMTAPLRVQDVLILMEVRLNILQIDF